MSSVCPNMNTILNASMRCLLMLAAPVALLSCSRPQQPVGKPPSVSVARPQVATVTNWDEYPGHLEAVESVEIRPHVSGYIDSIHFEDGAMTKAGDLLFVIDPRPYQAELDSTQARFELTQNDLKRAENLRSSKAISEEEYDSRSKLAREAKAALDTARLNSEYTRVTALINGRIGRRLVTAGNLVQGGGIVPGTLLTTLVTMDPIYCYFDVDERAFLQYRKASAALNNPARKDTSLPCELALDGEEGFPHKGRIDFFDNQINPGTGTIRLRGVFDNHDGALVPGGFARVRLPVSQTESALLIPEAAILSQQTQQSVFVVNAQQIVEPRLIQLGRQQGMQRVVLAGLKPDDNVVVSGVLMLRPGIKVQVEDPNAREGQRPPQANP